MKERTYFTILTVVLLAIMIALALGATLPPPLLHSKTTTNDVEGVQTPAASIRFAGSNSHAGIETFQAIWPLTNRWNGPSNTLFMNGSSWGYRTLTPVQVNDFSYPAGTPAAPSAVLEVINDNSGSNVTEYLPASVVTDDGLHSYTISNNTALIVSFEVSYGLSANGGLQTNAVARLFPAGTGGAVGTAQNSVNATNLFGPIYGTNFSFSSLSIFSQATNYILDAAQGVYQKILAGGNLNLLYATNAAGAAPQAAGAGSLKIYPNGGDRTLTINSNWILLDTNGWTLLTTMNPGLWQRIVTNAANANGARVGWLSWVCDDPNWRQTNVVANFLLSP